MLTAKIETTSQKISAECPGTLAAELNEQYGYDEQDVENMMLEHLYSEIINRKAPRSRKPLVLKGVTEEAADLT